MKSVFDFDPNLASRKADGTGLTWRSAKDPVFRICGSDALHEDGYNRFTKSEYDRIFPINDGQAWLSGCPSGIQLRFITDSFRLFVRGKLRAKFDMTNMTQIGQCGGDLYVFDEKMGEYVLHEVVRFPFDGTEYEVSLGHFDNAEKKERKYIFYFPLYMALETLSVGLDPDAAVRPLPFSDPVKIAVYGTSITQGCGASHPGLAYTNILSRKLDALVYNYGFSGSAMTEPLMGDIFGDHKVDLLILDTEPNAGVDERLENNLHGFLDAFFSKQPQTRVLIFSRISFCFDLYDEYQRAMHAHYVRFLRKTAKEYAKKGYKVLFADGSKIIKGNFTEAFVDGIHPNDIGMFDLAEAYEKQIARVRKIYGL